MVIARVSRVSAAVAVSLGVKVPPDMIVRNVYCSETGKKLQMYKDKKCREKIYV